MSQRESGYERVKRDLYETPAWVTDALIPHLGCKALKIWEPAAGGGKIVRALEAEGRTVIATDISTGQDFLKEGPRDVDAIVTNPPYTFAKEFIEHALTLTDGLVAMLLRTDFDHACGRANLFSLSPYFAKKVVLTRRIVWFERKGAAPSFNHAWYIWDKSNTQVAPVLAYGPAVRTA
jgi:hypothetical protein